MLAFLCEEVYYVIVMRSGASQVTGPGVITFIKTELASSSHVTRGVSDL
jgi:hypothetical protein